MSQPGISGQDMVDYFASGCKSRQQWGIGTEHEKLPFDLDNLRPVPYEGERGIGALLAHLVDHEWQAVYEQDKIIALQHGDGASITLEPGGQLELSGAVLPDLHQTHDETGRHLRHVTTAAGELGIGFLGCGFQPRWSRQAIPWMPKVRYAIMRDYMPKVGKRGLDMMLRTATVQANLDFASEADMARKMRLACCIQPIVTALFAASPFYEDRPAGVLSMRAACWLDTDPVRTGIPACVFADDFGFANWVEYLLDIPMYFVIRDGHYIDCSGQSFRDFLTGRLPQLPGVYPTLEDWALHASTAFPDVRLKQFIEVRGADASSHAMITALPALFKGLLYDESSEQQLWQIVGDWQHDEVCQLRQDVVYQGLDAIFRYRRIGELAAQILELAKQGLQRLDCRNAAGHDESIYLQPLQDIVNNNKTRAQQWLDAWHQQWQHSTIPLFEYARHALEE